MNGLSINGTILAEDELPEFCDKKLNRKGNIPSWEKKLYQFIQEWLNDAPYIEVSTSGSTGTPCGMELSKEKLVNSAKMTGDYFDLSGSDKAVLALSPEYIAGKMMVIRAFVLGLDLVTVEPTGDPMRAFGQNFQARFGAFVPMQVHNIFHNVESLQKFQNIDKVIIGGGAVSSDLHQRIKMLKNDVYATYGMTETLTHVAVKKLNGTGATPDFVAMEGVHLGQDKEGRLIITAPHLSEDPIHTNDLVEFNDLNRFSWLGRYDHVINSGGLKVIPEQVEKKLEDILDRRAFITSLKDSKFGEKIVLFVEGKEFDEATMNLFKNHLKEDLDPYEVPKSIHFVDRFAETPTGKVDRNATKEGAIGVGVKG